VQERLARSGYYRGPVDGVMGPRTRYAIRVYERRHGLRADGIIDRRLLATMGIA
jgi:peptidoglycan hydrolase-like protein with peptidoglycan-binding domain